jgi:hypothetical protein
MEPTPTGRQFRAPLICARRGCDRFYSQEIKRQIDCKSAHFLPRKTG